MSRTVTHVRTNENDDRHSQECYDICKETDNTLHEDFISIASMKLRVNNTI